MGEVVRCETHLLAVASNKGFFSLVGVASACCLAELVEGTAAGHGHLVQVSLLAGELGHALAEGEGFLVSLGSFGPLTAQNVFQLLLCATYDPLGLDLLHGPAPLGGREEGTLVEKSEEVGTHSNHVVLLAGHSLLAFVHGIQDGLGEELRLDRVDYVVEVLSGKRAFESFLRKIDTNLGIFTSLVFKVTGNELLESGHLHSDDFFVL